MSPAVGKPIVAAALLITLTLAACARAGGGRPAVFTRVLPAPPSVIPAPVTSDVSAEGKFALTPTTAILVEPGDESALRIGRYLAALVAPAIDLVPPVTPAAGEQPAGSIQLTIKSNPVAHGGHGDHGGNEGYELIVTSDRVTIAGNGPAGLFYGVQTLRQLLPASVEYSAARPHALTIPVVRIVDRPRFVWRGAMLDVARHFRRVEDVKRYVDLMALYKLNRLHLHLSDDQGWRIEIKSWPNLTKHGGSTEVGGGAGGYYTQEEYADLVAYAEARFITIVPEIDMPGHTNAALASYPELNCTGVAPPLYAGIKVGFSALCTDKDITYKFVDDVIREISALTPGTYFHIGGDEVKTLPPAQYAQFIERVQGMVQSHGKQTIGWDEIASARLLPTSVVQHWRPKVSRFSLPDGTKMVLSPANRTYLDMKYDKTTVLGLNWAGYVEVRDAYDWDPATTIEGITEGTILGVEAPLWSETVATMRDVEQLAFPRLAAIAEIGWTPAGRRNWEEFRVRLGAQAPRWSALGVNFYRAPSVPWKN